MIHQSKRAEKESLSETNPIIRLVFELFYLATPGIQMPIENQKKRRIITRKECPPTLPSFRTNRQIIRERLEKEILNRLKFKPSDEQKSKIVSICEDIEKELFRSHSDEKKYLAQEGFQNDVYKIALSTNQITAKGL